MLEANKPKVEKEKSEEKREEIPIPLVHVPLDIADDKVDIVRDIAWVYNHLNELIIEDLPGLRRVNLIALATAPSSGAVALVNFALCSFEAFFKVFVVRLLPRDISTEVEQTEEEVQAELDPDMKLLEKAQGDVNEQFFGKRSYDEIMIQKNQLP